MEKVQTIVMKVKMNKTKIIKNLGDTKVKMTMVEVPVASMVMVMVLATTKGMQIQMIILMVQRKTEEMVYPLTMQSKFWEYIHIWK